MTTVVELADVQRSRNGYRAPGEREAEELEVLRLKVLGYRDSVIAETLKMSLPTVKKRLQAAVKQHGQTRVEEYREVCAQRYEALVAMALDEYKNGAGLAAIAEVRNLTREFADLVGAKAPVQVDLAVTVETEQEKQLREMLAQAERDTAAREQVIVEGEVVTDAAG